MPEAQRIAQKERANASLSRCIEANPECTVDDDQPQWLIGTNFVTVGTYCGQPVVFKYFDWHPRKEQEERALRLFAPTGLVPKLYPISSDSLLVMERLRGSPLHVVEQDIAQDRLRRLHYQLGQALAQIVEVAPGAGCQGRRDMPAKPGFDYEFYCQADIGTLFDTVTGRAAKVLAEQDVPHSTVLQRSLAALRENRDAILAYPTFIQMDDFHTCNIMADGEELTGFIDLEMTRWGNEVLLLAPLAMAAYRQPERWSSIREGYEDRRGRPIDCDLLSLACIAAPLSQWTRFMWYWTMDPEKLEVGARGWPIRDIKAIVETVGDMLY